METITNYETDNNMQFDASSERLNSDYDLKEPTGISTKHNAGKEEELFLNSGNSAEDKKPNISYIALISMAIQSSPTRRMLLSEIYQWITEKYPYYSMENKSWRNSIRHNLSLNECFVKNGRSDNGKGNYWSIHPANMEDFSRGDFRRRRARRRVRKCDEELRKLCMPKTPESNMASTTAIFNAPLTDTFSGYVPMARSYVTPGYLASLFGHERIYTGYRQHEDCRYGYNYVEWQDAMHRRAIDHSMLKLNINTDSSRPQERLINNLQDVRTCERDGM